MPLQSSGIIVVDKTSVISQQINNSNNNNLLSTLASTTTTSTSSPSTTKRQNSNNRIHIHQQQQPIFRAYQIHHHQENDTLSIQSGTTVTKSNNLMRRQQRTISISSSPSSSSASPSVAAAASSSNTTNIVQQQLNNKTGITNLSFVTTSHQNFNQNQMNQQQHQKIHHQPQQHATAPTSHQPTQQVIQVSEDFIEHGTVASFATSSPATVTVSGGNTATTNVINLNSANEIINQTQIIKLVSDGNGGNVLIDSLGNVTATTVPANTTTNGGGNGVSNVGGHHHHLSHNHSNSKLLVSNLTVLPSNKQSSVSAAGQQSLQTTINFVNAKGLSYLTNTSGGGGNTSPTVAGTAATGVGGNITGGKSQQQASSSVQKIINIPIKTNNLIKNSSISSQQQQLNHHQHHHIAANSTTIAASPTTAATVMQKVTVPRNVQVVTRVQTVQPQAVNTTVSQQQQQQIQQIVHHSQQHHNIVQNNQMLMQQKYVHGIVTSPSNTNNNQITKMNNNSIKKQQTTISQNVKSHKTTVVATNNAQNVPQQGIKTFIQQPQTQFQSQASSTIRQIKSQQKVMRQLNNTAVAVVNTQNSPQTAVAVLTSNVQQQAITTPGTYTVSNSGKITNISVQQHSHSQNSNTTGAKFISGGNITSVKNSPMNTVTTKYIMQNHIVLPAGTNSSTLQQQQQQSNNQSNNVMQQQIISNINNSVVGTIHNNGSGTIKFVNAHGTVLQQQQQQSSGTIQQSQTHKMRNNNVHNQTQQQHNNNAIHQQQFNHVQQQSHQQQQQYAEAIHMTGNNVRMVVTGGSGNTTSSTINSNDDIVVVNGTQMTDEISARILQSMSQKSTFNNQQRQQQQFHHHHQQQQQHIKNCLPPPPPPNVSTTQSNYILTSTTLPREYPIYNPAQHHSSNLHQRQVHSTPSSRSQSLDRKQQQQHEVHNTKKSTESFKVNTKDLQASFSPSTTFIDNIPLPCPLQRGDDTPAAQQAEHEDDIIGEEIRPLPPLNLDQTLQGLYAVLLDHTYVSATHLNLEKAVAAAAITNQAVVSTPIQSSSVHHNHQQQQQQTSSSTITSISSSSTSSSNNNCNIVSGVGSNSSPTLISNGSGIYTISTATNCMPATVGGQNVIGQNTTVAAIQSASISGAGIPPPLLQAQSQQQQQQSGGASGSSVGSVVTNNGLNIITGSYGNVPSTTGGFSFSQGLISQRPQHDDDANSVISNESRNGLGLENDLGEETETAPEAEGEDEDEDDSITRCICDLTHDDGYMICCDKCSAWQHVDCMGIDRQNIPEEYLCEICQPRPVDKSRARSLQLMKRKEQAQMLANAAQLNSTAAAGTVTAGNGGILMQQDQLIGSGASSQLTSDRQLSSSSTSNKISATTSKRGKLATAAGTKKREILKKTKKEKPGVKKRGIGRNTAGADDSIGNASSNTKRTTKRKTKNSGNSGNETTTDKYTSNLRQWIENYELAMTNHYSPELRARLHAIGKQQNLLQSILASENKILKHCGGNGGHNLENRCTTVPHAGGKILISNHDIQPNNPIVELRGKYMLTTQYKNQNPSIFMNNIPSNNSGFHHHSLHHYQKNYQKIPGPFIFFYQLSFDTTTNSNTTTLATTTIAGINSNGPEICVDTRTYGNEARFVRRSCRPNAEIQHTFEKGTIHLYLVSLTNIMASTEITIRHEPHDLIALDNKSNFNFPIAPTSTLCACGLTKDCAFGGPQQQQLMLQPSTSQNKTTNRKTTMNGCLSDSRGKGIGKKASQNQSRGRSTSSSGESNIGLISPNNSNFTATTNLYNSAASISSILHDSGVYTSSSSPSVSLPSPTHTQTISSPPQIQQQQQQQQQSQQKQQPNSQQPQQQSQQAPPQFIPVPTQLQQNTTSVNAVTVLPPVATPPLTVSTPSSCPSIVSGDADVPNQQQQLISMKSPQKSNTGSRKAQGKHARQQSISEDGSQSGSSSQQEEKRESRKLTREERKMEAIVKAIEKMEKNQQRKQELKQAKTSSGSGRRHNSSSPSPKRAKISISGDSGAENNTDNIGSQQQQQQPQQQNPTTTTSVGRKPGSTRKKKRKGSKSYQTQSNIQRKRRQSRINSNESDMITSEESTSLLSPSANTVNISGGNSSIMGGFSSTVTNSGPSLQPPPIISSPPHAKVPEIVEKQMTLMTDLIESQATGDGGISQAAGLLMAFANPDKIVVNHHQHRERINSVDHLQTVTAFESTQHIQEQYHHPNSSVHNHIPLLNHQQCVQINKSSELIGENISNIIVPSSSVIAASMQHENKISPRHHHRSSIEMSPSRNHQVPPPQNSPQTPPIVSSTCLLVEAAVGPLENFGGLVTGITDNEFKIPMKTKTKKSIMNEWLNQSTDNQETIYQNVSSGSQIIEDIESPQHNTVSMTTEEAQVSNLDNYHNHHHQNKSLDTLVQAAATICDYRPINSPNSSATSMIKAGASSSSSYTSAAQQQQQIEPQNLTIVAKKVEEFIHQNDTAFIVNSNTDEMMKNVNIRGDIVSYTTTLTQQTDQILPQNQYQLSLNLQGTSGSSSVKKRWLRQAISEESDEISGTNNVPMAASSPTQQHPTTPPNGFTTPLKKRRVARQCNNNGRNDDEQISNGSPEEVSSSSALMKSDSDSNLMQVQESSGCGQDEGDEQQVMVIPNELKEENENIQAIKQEISNESAEDDVDVINSPSPNDNNVLTNDGNLIKIEPEDVNKEIKVDVEKEEALSNDNTVNTSIVVKKNGFEFDNIEVEQSNSMLDHKKQQDIKSFFELESVDKREEEKEEKKNLKIIKTNLSSPCNNNNNNNNNNLAINVPIIKHSTDDKKLSRTPPLGPLIPHNSPKNSSSTLTMVDSASSSNYENVSDEIADIQKRLHSFHTENIMILQSRNKKSKISRSLKVNNSNNANDNSSMKNKDEKSENKKSTTKTNKKKDEHYRSSKNSSKKRTSSESNISSAKEKDDTTSVKSRKISETTNNNSNSRKRKDLKSDFDKRYDHDSKTVVGGMKIDTRRKTTDDIIGEPRIKIEQSFTKPTPKIDDKQFQVALTIPNFNQNIVPPPLAASITNVASQNTISSYVLNSSVTTNISSSNQNYCDISSLLAAPPPPPPPVPPPTTVGTVLATANFPSVTVQSNLNIMSPSVVGQQQQLIQHHHHHHHPPPPLHLPYYNTIYGKLMDKTSVIGGSGGSGSTSGGNAGPVCMNVPPSSVATGIVGPTLSSLSLSSSSTGNNSSSSSLLLSDYLDTKAKSYSSLGGYVSHSALFGLNSGKTNVSVGGMLPASSVVTAVANSIDSSSNSSNNNNNNITASKILTKTASSDPRLNPILTAPEPPPAPKRKLSINEYRKRKQQSTESVATSASTSLSSSFLTSSQSGNNNSDQLKSSSNNMNINPGNDNNLNNSSGNSENSENNFNNDKDNVNIVDTPKVHFSPAPTMLEQQQEILCERLKSLKNKAAVVASLGTTNSTTAVAAFNSLSSSSSMLSLSSLKSVNNGDNCNNNISANTTNNYISGSSSSNSTTNLSNVTTERKNDSIIKNSGKDRKSLESISSISSSSSSPESSITPPLLGFDQKSLSPKCDTTITINNLNISSATESTTDAINNTIVTATNNNFNIAGESLISKNIKK